MFQHLRKPNIQRLTTALKSGQPDCVPLIELGIHPRIKQDIMGRPIYSVHEDAEFMRSMGYDFVKIQPLVNFKMDFGSINKSNANEKEIPVDRPWAPEGKGFIQTMEDLEKYPWPKASEINYSRLEQAKTGLPEGMGVIGQYGDIFTLAWEMMGFEAFALATYENPELVQALFDRLGNIICPMFETMGQMEWVDVLWYSDDIAYTGGLMMSPTFLRTYLFPWMKKMGDAAKPRNLPFIYHSDGILYTVVEDLINCGITALHPIEPKAMDIGEVKQKYLGRLALCGNIEVDTLSQGTPDEIIEQVKDRILKAAPGGGYCLGSSNSIPDYVKTENYLAMVKTALELGSY